MSHKSKFFTTKVHKEFSQRTQNIDKQIVAFVNLCVYFVLFVVKKIFETASLSFLFFNHFPMPAVVAADAPDDAFRF